LDGTNEENNFCGWGMAQHKQINKEEEQRQQSHKRKIIKQQSTSLLVLEQRTTAMLLAFHNKRGQKTCHPISKKACNNTCVCLTSCLYTG
jgi:hypothetical protein